MTETTNDITARAATTPAVLPLDGVQLIGIISAPDRDRALLRGADGAIHTVEAGAETPLGRLVGVGDGFALIDTGGNRMRRLTLPA